MSNSKQRPHISALIDKFVPDHVSANYPELIEFISAYLDFLETEHGASYYQNTLPQQRDTDLQEEQFLRRIEKEIGLFVPREYEATPRLFYNKISELWKSKGSQEALETFFRLFLNDTVQVRYPWDFVLKPSDGRWQAPQKLRVSLIRGDADDFSSQRIQQIEEYGFATVTRVERKVYADQTIFELTLLRAETVGGFNVGNRITTEDRSVEAEIYNSLSNINVTQPGTDYQVGDRIRLQGLSRISFEARVNRVDESGGISGVSIIDFGSGTTPDHIRDVRASGKFFLFEFNTFRYLDEDRDLLIADNQDITNETLLGFRDEYSGDPYFGEPYTGTAVFSAEDQSLVDDPIQTEEIVITPVDPSQPLVFEVDSVDGIGAKFSLEFDAIIESSGFYDGIRGQLSNAIVLQDSEFYQKFSYEVVTSYPINQWINPLKKHVHPSGTKPFGLINHIERIEPLPDVLSLEAPVLVPEEIIGIPDLPSKTFTKIINECAVCGDETNVTSKEDLSFTKVLNDFGGLRDSFAVSSQNYTSQVYFSEDYVGQGFTV